MPIRIAIISPISHLDRYVPHSDQIAMALTHLVLADKQYAEFYRQLRKCGFHIILDNSAFELEQQGKGLDPEPVLEAAQIIDADEIICTDVLCDFWKTIESTNNFIDQYHKIWPEQETAPQLQAVVQGANQEEWWECYRILLKMPEISVLGFSKIAIPHCFYGNRITSGCVTKSRLIVSEAIENDVALLPTINGKSVHLLGGDNWSAYELSIQTKYRWIRSNDTSMPIWYGCNSQAINLQTGKIESIIIEKPDLENKNPSTKASCDQNENVILHNIAVLHKFSKWHMEK